MSLRDLTVENTGTGDTNVALSATGDATDALVADVTVHAHGAGTNNYAILLYGSSAHVTRQTVTALAENGSTHSIGLYNHTGSTAALYGGSFTGRGGVWVFGIWSTGNGTVLEAYEVVALGEDGSATDYGLTNGGGSVATLRGGSFTGRTGHEVYGIYNSGSSLEADGVTALAENGSTHVVGLYNQAGATATLRGSSFTGSGGVWARGIDNRDTGTVLEANQVIALGENGSASNCGLQVYYSGTAEVAHSVLEGASTAVHNNVGTIIVSNSRLIGGPASGPVTCVAVSRGTTFSPSGCP